MSPIVVFWISRSKIPSSISLRFQLQVGHADMTADLRGFLAEGKKSSSPRSRSSLLVSEGIGDEHRAIPSPLSSTKLILVKEGALQAR
jgi:hypothetical protein